MFIMSLSSIIFSGVFIEGLVNPSLHEDDLVANLNVSTSLTIFIDVLFFMMVQKALEINLGIIMKLIKYGKLIAGCFYITQAVSLGFIMYFGMLISIIILRKLPEDHPHKYIYCEMILIFLITRVVV